MIIDDTKCPVTGKIIYPDKETAKKALARLQRKRRGEQGMYKCWHCRGVHLSSQRQSHRSRRHR